DASMATSCVAAPSPIAIASAPTTQIASGRWPTPASMRLTMNSTICVTAIHPRRRPPTGGTYRSMSGAQSSLNVQGACASVMRPTTRMSTPMSRIQSGMAIQTRPSGKPDANICSTTNAVRFERIATARLAKAPVGALGGFRVITLTLFLLFGRTGCAQHPRAPVRSSAWRPWRCDVLVQPLANDGKHLMIVLFHQHEVAIAVDPVIAQPKHFHPATDLLQELDVGHGRSAGAVLARQPADRD